MRFDWVDQLVGVSFEHSCKLLRVLVSRFQNFKFRTSKSLACNRTSQTQQTTKNDYKSTWSCWKLQWWKAGWTTSQVTNSLFSVWFEWWISVRPDGFWNCQIIWMLDHPFNWFNSSTKLPRSVTGRNLRYSLALIQRHFSNSFAAGEVNQVESTNLLLFKWPVYSIGLSVESAAWTEREQQRAIQRNWKELRGN